METETDATDKHTHTENEIEREANSGDFLSIDQDQCDKRMKLFSFLHKYTKDVKIKGKLTTTKHLQMN